METELTVTTSGGLWSETGVIVTMEPLDNVNGNKFIVQNNTFAIVLNSDAISQTVQFTSQPHPETGRSGDVNQQLAAGEIRFFRFTKPGWADSSGYVLMPSGQNANLQVGIVKLS
jgi:hypothetical protein